MSSDTERQDPTKCRVCGGSGRIALGGFNCAGQPKPGMPMDCGACGGSGEDCGPLRFSGRLPGPGDEIAPGERLAEDCEIDWSALERQGFAVETKDGVTRATGRLVGDMLWRVQAAIERGEYPVGSRVAIQLVPQNLDEPRSSLKAEAVVFPPAPALDVACLGDAWTVTWNLPPELAELADALERQKEPKQLPFAELKSMAEEDPRVSCLLAERAEWARNFLGRFKPLVPDGDRPFRVALREGDPAPAPASPVESDGDDLLRAVQARVREIGEEHVNQTLDAISRIVDRVAPGVPRLISPVPGEGFTVCLAPSRDDGHAAVHDLAYRVTSDLRRNAPVGLRFAVVVATPQRSAVVRHPFQGGSDGK